MIFLHLMGLSLGACIADSLWWFACPDPADPVQVCWFLLLVRFPPPCVLHMCVCVCVCVCVSVCVVVSLSLRVYAGQAELPTLLLAALLLYWYPHSYSQMPFSLSRSRPPAPFPQSFPIRTLPWPPPGPPCLHCYFLHPISHS